MTATADTGAATRSRRPQRSTVLVVLVVLATLVVVALGTRTAARDEPLDPDNPGSDGAQALARVLDDEGVDVEVVRDAAALEDAEVDDDTTVLVTSSASLGRGTADRLREHVAGSRLVVARPGIATLDLLGVDDLPVAGLGSAELRADCADEGDALPDLDGLGVDVTSADLYPLPGCFGTEEGTVLAHAGDGLLLLGADGILGNEQVLRADNAAVALRLLGDGDRLLWYVPDPADVSASDAVGLGSLLPPWLVPSLWLLLLTSIVATWWRARRFGPLVVEPLPVSVRATETTRSRGRLYHRAGDRAHAAATLRAATRARVAAHLGSAAPSSSPHDDPWSDPLADEVARHTGLDPVEVRRLLSPHAPPPTTDPDLITLADQLAQLDREVRRP